MSSAEVLAKPAELRGQQHEMSRRAAAAQADFDVVETELEDLSSQFRGAAADAFAQNMAEWQSSATGLVEGLVGMAGFLGSTAEAFEAVDSGLAAGLGDGGGSRVSALIAANVEELRSLSRSFRLLTRTIDGEAQDLLRSIGVDQRDIGGRKTHDALHRFHGDWSDARKNLVSTATAAEQFLDSAAGSFEDLDRQLRAAMTGEASDGSGAK